jgi:hypothetical protein
MHHIFQTMDLMSKANKIALAAAHQVQDLHYDKFDHSTLALPAYPTVDSAVVLCNSLTSNHRRVI